MGARWGFQAGGCRRHCDAGDHDLDVGHGAIVQSAANVDADGVRTGALGRRPAAHLRRGRALRAASTSFHNSTTPT